MGGQQHQREPWVLVFKGEFIVSAENRIVCQFFNKRDENFIDYNANADRIVACVNAMAGKPAPERWVSEAEAILNSIYSFEHPQLKLGSSKVEVLLQMAKERDQLLDQLKKLLHMHSCEQEGIIMPTAAQWFHAVNEAEEVAFKIDPSPYNPNE